MRIPKPQRGVTLIEVAVSTALVGMVLVASLETLGGSMRTTRATTETIDAYSVLEQMMAEVRAVPFEDPDGNTSGLGIESDEPSPPPNRSTLDDVDDFDRITITPPIYRDGTPIPGYDGWTQRYDVSYAVADPTNNSIRAVSPTDEGLRLIRCRMTSPSGTIHQTWMLRSAHGPTEEPAPFDTTRVAVVGVEVQVGTADAVRDGVALDNLAELP